MMWDQVLFRIAALVQEDPVLRPIYGENMRMMGEGNEHQVPVLEWILVGDTETELWAPCTIQFDQWTPTMGELVLSERRLRTLFHTSLPAEFNGLRMWCEYVDGNVLASPHRDGVDGRSVRFRFTPLRGKYALQSPISLTP